MDTVVLLHGLGRTRFSMAIAASRLRQAGFATENIGYPSRVKPIEEHAEWVRARLPDPNGASLHFLTHSMGGIVLRALVARDRPDHLGRVVMLSPPNQGSRAAGMLREYGLYRMIAGPSGQQIGDSPDSLPKRLGPVDFELGVITGNKGVTPLSLVLESENDGVVRVDEASVDGAVDFLVVPKGHSFIMNDRSVLEQAIHFFRNGRFNHPEKH
jgi:triacylglycerol lipase